MLKLLEWIAVFVTLAGATATSAGIDPLNIYLLNAGSLLWLIWSLCRKTYSIALVNGGMLMIYFAGLIKRIDFAFVYDWVIINL